MGRGIPKPKGKTQIRKATRITYKDVDGMVESMPLLLGCELVIVQIDRENKVFRVLDASTKRLCFLLGKGKDVADCKREARKRLMNCRASVLDEVRVRK